MFFFSTILYLGFYSRFFMLIVFYCLVALVSLMHHVYVGHVIDFSIALNCIACSDDHLLDKYSLWSFPNDYLCLIKLCLMSYILFGILIAFYLFLIHTLCFTCLELKKVYLLCASVSGYRCIWCKCFITSRVRCE